MISDDDGWLMIDLLIVMYWSISDLSIISIISIVSIDLSIVSIDVSMMITTISIDWCSVIDW